MEKALLLQEVVRTKSSSGVQRRYTSKGYLKGNSFSSIQKNIIFLKIYVLKKKISFIVPASSSTPGYHFSFSSL